MGYWEMLFVSICLGTFLTTCAWGLDKKREEMTDEELPPLSRDAVKSVPYRILPYVREVMFFVFGFTAGFLTNILIFKVIV